MIDCIGSTGKNCHDNGYEHISNTYLIMTKDDECNDSKKNDQDNRYEYY